MNQVFVITRSDELARSLARYFRHTQSVGTEYMYPSMESEGSQHHVIHNFQHIANWIESKARGDEGVNLRNSLVFIDLFDKKLERFEDLNPLATDQGNWSATVAMLLLAFPEAQWVLNTPYKTPDEPLFMSGHILGAGNNLAELTKLRDADYTPLFDPAGLRLRIRKKLSKTPKSSYVPVRHHIAVAIDEEDDYAHFNSYMAYRLGYRSHVISSYLMMEKILWRPDPEELQKAQNNGHNTTQANKRGNNLSNGYDEHVELIFEDLYLNFPDNIDPDLHLSNLRTRSKKFKALDDRLFRKQTRAVVTVGHDIDDSEETVRENKEFLDEWVGRVARGTRKFSNVLKPVSGYFHLLEQSGVDPPGDYLWPPTMDDLPDPEDPSLPTDTSSRRTFYTSGHSSPGRLLEIAEKLICRTELNTEHVHTVAQAVYGATLALEAQEYLGHRTPTSSLHALALKHKFEVSAECLFYGVGTNKEVKKRFSEIQKEISSISRWLSSENRKAAQLDAESSIISKLMLIFRQNYQFDEEQACLKRLRELNRKLWSRRDLVVRGKQIKSFKQRRQLKFWQVPLLTLKGFFGWIFHWPISIGRYYVDSLMNSLVWFGVAILAWVIALSVMYGGLCGCSAPALEDQTLAPILKPLKKFHSTETHLLPVLQTAAFYSEKGMMHALTAFFGLQPPHDVEEMEDYGPFPMIVTVVAIAFGFVHLGIFVSHVYSVISRR